MSYQQIKKTDKQYPNLLKQINDSPDVLYYRGDWNKDIFKNCLAVVGSRKMTNYGKKVITKLVSEIAGNGITIVSGFMYGVDATAHEVALRAGGKTIAVMPCGIERIHPAYQKSLYNQILEKNGLIISELPGDKAPQKWTYPKRNRIVCGLSQATLVIEAAENSGSLITAQYAKKFERRLFSIPGPITSIVSSGTNNLIKDGAYITTNASDIISFYKKRQQKINFGNEKEEKVEFESKLLEKIINLLKLEELEPDEISRKLNLSASEVGISLSELQISGVVSKKGNKYYLE